MRAMEAAATCATNTSCKGLPPVTEMSEISAGVLCISAPVGISGDATFLATRGDHKEQCSHKEACRTVAPATVLGRLRAMWLTASISPRNVQCAEVGEEKQHTPPFPGTLLPAAVKVESPTHSHLRKRGIPRVQDAVSRATSAVRCRLHCGAWRLQQRRQSEVCTGIEHPGEGMGLA
eukprot:1148961-Pelagomonas_calceolata.AAC.2